jgi:hypothetical protein
VFVVFCWCKASVSSVGDLRFRLEILVWAAAKNLGFRGSVRSQENPLLMAGVLKPVMLWPELYKGETLA